MPGLPSTSCAIIPMLWNPCKTSSLRSSTAICCLHPAAAHFAFLNTTVNDTLPDKSYSGLYLKFANLYAENTIHNDVCLFRGFPTVARKKNMNLHSTWQLETQTEAFPEIDGLMSGKSGNLSESWFLTSVYQLPDTWESVPFSLYTRFRS